jgi:hypothetical protein
MFVIVDVVQYKLLLQVAAEAVVVDVAILLRLPCR